MLNGLLLPIILVFVMLLAGDRSAMGDPVSGRLHNVVGWSITVQLAVHHSLSRPQPMSRRGGRNAQAIGH